MRSRPADGDRAGLPGGQRPLRRDRRTDRPADRELGLAASLHGWKLNDLAHHPTSGSPNADARLPHWDDVRDLVVRSHRSSPGRRVIGWDIAITADGSVIVEGNVAPGLDLIQRTQGPSAGADSDSCWPRMWTIALLRFSHLTPPSSNWRNRAEQRTAHSRWSPAIETPAPSA